MSRRIFRPVAMLSMLLLLLMAAAPTLAYHDDPNADHGFADPAFQRTWERTDKHVAESGANAERTWIWGPEPYTDGMMEDYVESPGGQRLVQYFDKSRMELNCPADEAACDDVNEDSPWYVTNGLLVVDMVEGQVQEGDAEFDETPEPADINIVGDPGERPTYADINTFDLRSEPAAEDGDLLNLRYNDDGTIEEDTSFDDEDITAAYRVTEPGIDHSVASVFWDFMNSSGTVWENGAYVQDELFENPFYATGFPITEGYWSNVEVGGTERDVFWQCFERRCLTYTPGNPDGFLVEAGNVGQHYYRWEYGDEEPAPDQLLFRAELNGANEQPDPVDTEATGDAWFYLDTESGEIWYELRVENITDANAAHIHLGGADDVGDVLVPLYSTQAGDEFTGSGVLVTGQLTEDMLPDDTTWAELLDLMESGGVYVNVHSIQNGPGEIRGQVMTVEHVEMQADLLSENEVPPVDTEATGSATYVYDLDGTPEELAGDTGTISYSIDVAGIDNVTAAHIHLGGPDVTGPVVATLFTANPPVDPADGELTSGVLQADDLVNDLAGEPLERLVWEMVTGNTYTNVHTSDHPTGEIRGQNMVTVEAEPAPEDTSFSMVLFGINDSGVSGTGTLDAGIGGSWELSLDIAGLEANTHMAHIHGFDDDLDTVAFCPTPAQAGGDDLITLEEGEAAYGEVLFPIDDMVVGVDGIGTIDGDILVNDFSDTPLRNNVVVVHGMTIDPDGEGPEPAAYDADLPVACGLIIPNNDDGFIAELDGDNVAPDAVVTDTTGTFVVRINADGSVMSFQIGFTDAEMINDARIFLGAEGTVGDTALSLFNTESQPFEGDGQLWSGLVTDDMVNGILDLDGLVDEMQSGNAYVEAGFSTGQGDYDALVRGQIMTMTEFLLP